MENGNTSPLYYCRDLQKLISVTLAQVIAPIRKVLKHRNASSDILALEITDAENKTYEYIAQQICTICNVEETYGNQLFVDFPKSEPCYQCLGIDDDRIQGLLRIRGVSFLQLLEMPDEEVDQLLRTFGARVGEVTHVLTGLTKIRNNIALLQNESRFDDDTRNLIKLVVRLTEGEEEKLVNEAPTPLPVPVPLPSAQQRDRLSSQASSGGGLLSEVEQGGSSSQFPQTSPEEDLVLILPSPAHHASGSRSPHSHPRTASTSDCYHPLAAASTKHPVDPDTLRRVLRSRENLVSSSRIDHDQEQDAFLSTPQMVGSGGRPLDCTSLSVPSTPAPFVRQQPTQIQPPRVETPPPSPHGRTRLVTQVVPLQTPQQQPATPPPYSKHRLKIFPLHRSKSHESNLANRVATTGGAAANKAGAPVSGAGADVFRFPDTPGVAEPPRRASYEERLGTVVPPSSPKWFASDGGAAGADRSGYEVAGSGGLLMVPVMNPPTHKFELEAKLGNIVREHACSACGGRMSFLIQSCVYCKKKVHKSCVARAQQQIPCQPVSKALDGAEAKIISSPKHFRKVSQLSLPSQRVDTGYNSGSPSAPRKVSASAVINNHTNLRPAHSTPAFQASDSTSASSCGSSTAGSPFAVDHVSQPSVATSSTTISAGSTTGPGSVAAGQQQPRDQYSPRHPAIRANHFHFPAISESSKDGHSMESGFGPVEGGVGQAGSAGAVVLSDQEESTSSPITALISTVSSGESDKTIIEQFRLRIKGPTPRLESMDSQDDNSKLVRNNSISVALKEWDIPLESLIIGEVIGQGSFGTVYRGKWHGEVAIKRLDLDPEDEDGSGRMEAFKREVATLHKTRHENLVLFMGACMKPPDLAIVTQLSQGETLYSQLHERRSALTINRAINIASQVAKGMGYLHARGIVHRDLKSRNVFIEANSKAVISDFGLFNFMRLCKKAKYGSYLSVPPGWLRYLAPEVVRALNLNNAFSEKVSELPFTTQSDMFAFGTVWYELLTCEWPFKGMPAETIIYLVGRGVKPSVRIAGPKDFKDILVQCWSYDPGRRPEFTKLVQLLDRLPKLHRSPSYPVRSGAVSRSHESLVS